MAQTTYQVIEGDGSQDTVTLTDDPVEDATVQAVKNAIGDQSTASQGADSAVAATLIERVTALVDTLTSGQADDELRVALATDLLSGALSVSVDGQTGTLDVNLASDSLTGNLDVDIAAQTSGALTVTDDGSLSISSIPATAAEAAALPSEFVVVAGDDGTDTHPLQLNGDDLQAAIEQWNAGTLSVQEATALDVSAATVTVTDGGSFSVSSIPGSASEGGALPSEFVVVAGDDGTDTHPVQLNGDDLKVAVEQWNAGGFSVAGDTAHDAADSGNPVKVGGVYKNSPASVADGDRTDLRTNDVGDVSLVPLSEGEDAVEIYGSDDGGTTQRVIATDSNGQPQVDLASSLPAGSNNIGSVTSQPEAQTSGGWTPYRTIDLDEAAEEIKASAGQIGGYYIHNSASSVRYLKIYDATSANVTVGTTTPAMTIPLPANAAANLSDGMGIEFTNGITVAATTDLTGSAAPGTNEVVANLFYK